MTEDDLDKLEALANAATPSPWYANFTDDDMCMSMVVISTTIDIDDHGDPEDAKNIVAATLVQHPRYMDVADGRWDQNADLIAAMRNKLPELLKLARRGLASRPHP